MDRWLDFLLHHWQLSALFVSLLSGYAYFEWTQNRTNPHALSPEQAIALYNHENALFFDIRLKTAYDSGHILGAQHVELSSLKTSLKPLTKYLKKTVIVICDSGKASAKARVPLEQLGFERIFYLEGGLPAWQAANLPLTTS